MSFISKERVRLEEGGEGIFGIKKNLVYLIFSERVYQTVVSLRYVSEGLTVKKI